MIIFLFSPAAAATRSVTKQLKYWLLIRITRSSDRHSPDRTEMERFHSPLIELKTEREFLGIVLFIAMHQRLTKHKPKLNNDCGNICLIIIRRQAILHSRPRALCGSWWF